MIIWLVPVAVTTVLRTLDDGCGRHAKHVQWSRSKIKYRLHIVASRWTFLNIFRRFTFQAIWIVGGVKKEMQKLGHDVFICEFRNDIDSRHDSPSFAHRHYTMATAKRIERLCYVSHTISSCDSMLRLQPYDLKDTACYETTHRVLGNSTNWWH